MVLPEARNMSHIPSAIGVPWFRRESYDRIQSLPGSDLRDSFEQWEERAHRMFNVMYAAGQPVTRIVLEPEELRAFPHDALSMTLPSTVPPDRPRKPMSYSRNLSWGTMVSYGEIQRAYMYKEDKANVWDE